MEVAGRLGADIDHGVFGLFPGHAILLEQRDGFEPPRSVVAVTTHRQPAEPDPRSEVHLRGRAAGRAGATLLDGPERPTAISAVNDNTAIGALAAAHRRGLRVPFDQIARGALDLLPSSDVAEPRTITTTPALIPRASTTAPAT
ncbi:MAG: substrate-binding domain-containing protein [Saccharopolyspora sp.]|nr:substrate-binding domain-containing protein [Saccharopolyspora sp.]